MTAPLRPGLVPTEGRPKRFRLSIVGADEDVPRVLRAYGRACDGEFGLVMRPPEPFGLLVLIQKDGSATHWRGDHADKADAPLKPILKTDSRDAVSQIRTAQKSVPKVGPVTLRGRWTGYLYCESGQPRVELKRRLASYGSLWVFSNGTDGWAWTFERDSKWFGKAGETSGKGLPTLQDAIHIAVLGAMKLVQDACSFRDTRRRAAVDEDYAEVHPIKKREPKADPTDRMKVREPKKPRARKARAEKPEVAAPARAPRAPAVAPTAPAARPPKQPRTRKAPAAAAASQVDAEKDKALIDAFSQAFAAVLGEGA